jgi:hypothetical protein
MRSPSHRSTTIHPIRSWPATTASAVPVVQPMDTGRDDHDDRGEAEQSDGQGERTGTTSGRENGEEHLRGVHRGVQQCDGEQGSRRCG